MTKNEWFPHTRTDRYAIITRTTTFMSVSANHSAIGFDSNSSDGRWYDSAYTPKRNDYMTNIAARWQNLCGVLWPVERNRLHRHPLTPPRPALPDNVLLTGDAGEGEIFVIFASRQAKQSRCVQGAGLLRRFAPHW
jgi:hypothetical protein